MTLLVFGGGLAAHNLVEIALSATRGLFLIEESQFPFIELFEPVIPRDMLQRVFLAVTRKIESQHPYVVRPACTLHAGRCGAARLCPAPDLIMICRGM
jgi:hypothetical protein